MSRLRKLGFVAAASAVVAGCSVHPTPDDVSPVPTEVIVKSIRCESKLAVHDIIARALKAKGITTIQPEVVLQPANLAAIRLVDPVLATKFELYGASAIAYDFTFDVTETNNIDSSASFSWPFSAGSVSVNVGQAYAHKMREGKRTFNATENFAALADLDCSGFEVRQGDLLYPVNGSIGMKRIVDTFVAISEQSASKVAAGQRNFQDTLTFTTEVDEQVNPSVTFTAPIPLNQFRLKAFSLTDENRRRDYHVLTVGLAFPDLTKLPVLKDTFNNLAVKSGAPAGGLSSASIKSLAVESAARAQENLCIAKAQSREDQFGTLRLQPPEIYCKVSGTP